DRRVRWPGWALDIGRNPRAWRRAMSRAGQMGVARRRMARRGLQLLLTAAVVAAAGLFAPAAPAAADVTAWLDPTFGPAGTTTLSGEPPSGISNADAQDRVYVMSDAFDNVQNTTTIQLRRLLANGTVDSAFGGGSVILTTTFASFPTSRVHADAGG